eukprot:CAMPEP_0194263272 /NCGR_PEP_ID=MMETSP0158-20130606/46972_1 /TAXON_ID=33649 /ORGANISM="Thalassionema nitzschioides, Strain L26-B" /LENGTH=220 /DNA_ID=CAMNT_0039003451 /DNA_START=291 /DNA_END=954 /DNA_ORIENTATION=-
MIVLLQQGTIELEELQQVMKKLGQNPSKEELKEIEYLLESRPVFLSIKKQEASSSNCLSTVYHLSKTSLIMAASRDLSEDDIADLKEAFSMFDINGDGTIELEELQQVMKKLGQNPSKEELKEMINSVDDNGDNEIDFDEFLILMKSRIGERDPEKELRDAFAVFDTDGSGSIDRRELKRLMKKLGQALTEPELNAMMEEVDTNGDGEISFEEFKAMMQS